jgi:hypothetical protein
MKLLRLWRMPFLLVLFSTHPTNEVRGMRHKENERNLLQRIENQRFTKIIRVNPQPLFTLINNRKVEMLSFYRIHLM